MNATHAQSAGLDETISRWRSGVAVLLAALLCSVLACGGAELVPEGAEQGAAAVEVPPPPAVPTLPALPAILQPAAKTAVPARLDLPGAAELEGAWARVYLLANPGPFQYVAYEVTARGGAGVVSHLRGTMGRRDAISRTELISRQRLAGLMATLRDQGAAKLPDPGPLPGSPQPTRGRADPEAAAGQQARSDVPLSSAVPIYELSYRLGKVEKTWHVADPYLQTEPGYGRFINTVRSFVIQSTGEIAYHGPTGPPGKRGFLFIDSVPGSVATVDGVQLPDQTPIFAYPLAAGAHIVVLKNAEHGLEQTYKVKVQPGMTTSLEVDLR